MKISIVTINYNGAISLDRTIQSVIAQTHADVEYVVIDGGSTDASLEILKKYESRIHFWSSEKDRGISHAFNKGIAACHGEWIGIINSDDWYEPNIVELVADLAGKNPQAEVICGGMQNWECGKKEMFLMPDKNIDRIKSEMILAHPACFIKKSAYEKYGIFDESYRYAMDYELFLRFYLKGAQFLLVNSHFSNMQLNGKSGRFWYKACHEILRAHLQYFKSPIGSYADFLFKIFRTGFRTLLCKTGLGSFVAFWRSFQSTKRYPRD